jgi:hypothetical protein
MLHKFKGTGLRTLTVSLELDETVLFQARIKEKFPAQAISFVYYKDVKLRPDKVYKTQECVLSSALYVIRHTINDTMTNQKYKHNVQLLSIILKHNA